MDIQHKADRDGDEVAFIEAVTRSVCRKLALPFSRLDEIRGICAVAVLESKKNCKESGKRTHARYLYLRAYQDAKRALRRDRKEAHSEFCEEEEAGYEPAEPLDVDGLKLAIKSLDSDGQRLIRLRYWGGLTLEQIAAKVGEPLTTVQRHLKGAEARLRLFLEGEG